MATLSREHQGIGAGSAADEDFYGPLATSLMEMFHASGFVASVRQRPAPSDAWGPTQVAYQRGCGRLAAEPLTSSNAEGHDWLRPQGSTRAIGGIVTRNAICQVRLSLLRAEGDRPFGNVEMQLGQQLKPLLEGVITTRMLLQQAREQPPRAAEPGAGAQPWSALRLTRAEEEVLELLLQGYGVKQISQRRRSSYHTVRSQLASLLSKANCHSQRELIVRMQMH